MLPFSSDVFDLVINRHESYSPTEVARVMTPTGLLVTQQVGGRDESELLAWFDRPGESGPEWNLEVAQGQLEAAGYVIVDGPQLNEPNRFRRLPPSPPKYERHRIGRQYGCYPATGLSGRIL